MFLEVFNHTQRHPATINLFLAMFANRTNIIWIIRINFYELGPCETTLLHI